MRARRFGRQYEITPEKNAKPINRESLHVYRRMFAYTKPYRWWLALALGALTFSALANLVMPLVIRNLVDVVLVAGDQSSNTLNGLAAGLFGLFALQGVFSFINRLSSSFVGEKITAELRTELYAHLQRLSLSYYADHRTGELVSRFASDTKQMQQAVSENVVALIRQFIILTGAIGLLFYLNWQLTLIIIVCIPITTLFIVFLGRKIRFASGAVQDTLAESSNIIEETVSGIRIVKSFAREPYELARYQERINALYESGMYRARISAVLGPVIGFIAYSSITITLWFGSMQVLNGNLTAGGLVAYLVYTMMIGTPIASLANLYSQFQAAIGATEQLFVLLDTPIDIEEKEDAPALPSVQGNVEFQDVSFQYNDRVGILDGVSFSAEKGQIIALVGPSGAGKSTLVNLIPRFYDVQAGTIMIDGHDIRDISLSSLREQIGIVPQETILFSDTVAQNIRYGNLKAKPKEIKAAAEAANAHDFIINDLPNGYETLVGERGVKLSGGQRQRVSIARAILKDPRILILDEATSSLDSESERLVQSALEYLMNGRTSFVIAHRLSTIVNADCILVMDKGRIVEQGTHTDLLNNPDGLYHYLYSMQFKEIS